MKVIRLDGPFGVSVEGVDLSQDQSDATIRALIDLLHEHQILAIVGQDLTDAQYVDFGRKWGEPISFFIASHQNVDHPELIRIHNAPTIPERFRDGAMHWHADSSYEAQPASVTMLYGVEAPDVGGETWFASARLAYDALDYETKERINGLTGVHCLGGSPELPGEKIPIQAPAIARMGITQHPLVMRHPVTGAKAIYTSGTAFGAEGLEDEEGRSLIAMLRQHTTKPEFCIRYKVKKGDVFLWDNFQVMHTATQIEYSGADGKRRLLHRISTKGVPQLCA